MPGPNLNKGPVKKNRRSRAKPKQELKQRGWATPDQDDFLSSYLLGFKASQASRKFEVFWKEIDNMFNEKWLPDNVSEQKKVCVPLSPADFDEAYMLHRTYIPGSTTKQEPHPQRLT